MMHLLAISLLTILAGTLLLAKIKKDELGKFFTYVSWFFIVVGFILFIGFIARGICYMNHGCITGHSDCRQEMMMKECNHGMHNCICCPPGTGTCVKKDKCMQHDSIMKFCPGHHEGDTSKMFCPKSKLKDTTE
jgi:hypothetical protein